MDDPGLEGLPLREEMRADLLATGKITDLLEAALDDLDHGWEALWIGWRLPRLDVADPSAFDAALRLLSPASPAARALRLKKRLFEKRLQILADLGLHYDPEDGLVQIPTGGHHRNFYRNLVAALKERIRAQEGRLPRREIIKRIAPVLSPFFASDRVTLDSDGLLAKTYDNI